jgi:hypothetical protein
MTKKSWSKNGGQVHSALVKSLRLVAGLSREIVNELRRLNSARLGQDELSRLARGQRARAVKDALAAHHRGASRCC